MWTDWESIFGANNLTSLGINALWAGIGASGGYFGRSFTRFYVGRRRDARVRAANKKAFVDRRVLVVSGSRFEFTKSQCRFTISNERFIANFPNNLRAEMLNADETFIFNDQILTEVIARNRELVRTVVPAIDQLIVESENEVARDFISKASRSERLFNGDLYCALTMPTSAGYDSDEHPNITTVIYQTDYFTNQVIHKCYTKCRHLPAIKQRIDSGRLTEELRFFLNGYGLNCLVCALPVREEGVSEKVRRPDADGSLIFGKRGGRVSVNDATGSWHVTANEGLSKTDVEDQRVSLDRWVRRALHEEVAIKESEILRTVILTETLHLGDMQPGLMMIAFCEVDLETLKFRVEGAQDARMEYDDYTLLPFSNAAIQRALENGGLRDANGVLHRFSASSENILNNILARGTENFLVQ